MNNHLVFVYGSLRNGSARPMSMRFPQAKFIAAGTVNGSLYDFGAYPALLLDGDAPVNGEIYEVDDEILAELDEFEASSDYFREQVDISIGNHKRISWIYVPKQNPEFYLRRPLISSGDWIQYSRSKTG